MQITLLETVPEFRKVKEGKRNDLIRIYRDFKESDAQYAKVEWAEMDYPDALHCYKAFHLSFTHQNAACKQKIKVKKKGDDIYLIKV